VLEIEVGESSLDANANAVATSASLFVENQSDSCTDVLRAESCATANPGILNADNREPDAKSLVSPRCGQDLPTTRYDLASIPGASAITSNPASIRPARKRKWSSAFYEEPCGSLGIGASLGFKKLKTDFAVAIEEERGGTPGDGKSQALGGALALCT